MQQPTDRIRLFRPFRLFRPLATACGVVFLLAGLGACSPHINKQGNEIEPQVLSQVKPGVQTKDQVQSLIGSPSSVAAFDPNIWYYISKRSEQWAFLDPMVLEEEVVQVQFDDQGVVKSVRKYGEDDAQNVAMVSRTTPSRGRSITVLDEVYNTLMNQFSGGSAMNAMASRDPFAR
jgi:outer membrane protein assembly factor BamE (lipoprotein component of BamABCDE complex)